MITNNNQRKKDEDIPVGNHLGTQLLVGEDNLTGVRPFDEVNHADAYSRNIKSGGMERSTSLLMWGSLTSTPVFPTRRQKKC